MHPMSTIMVAVAGCIAIASPSAAAPPQAPLYRVTILSDPNTTATAGAVGSSIDDIGIVTGSYALTGGAVHASLWAFGQLVDLGTLGSPALNSRVLWPVKNVLGLVSGISLTDQADPNKENWSCAAFIANPNANVCRGFLWNPITRKMRALPTLGGPNGFATGTNNDGETVGWAENKVHDKTCIFPQVLQFKPVVWGPDRDDVRALPLIGSDGSGAATALNDHGQIVGISGDCQYAVGFGTAKHAVLWDHGAAVLLANPYGDAAPYWNTPMMINERGDVVGFAGVPNDPFGNNTPPFLWTRKGGWTWLPMVGNDIAGVASGINNHGVIVGYSNDASAPANFHPWVRMHGVTRNLNDLIEPGSGLTGPIILALDINDRGEITGTTQSGQAFVATPVVGR